MTFYLNRGILSLVISTQLNGVLTGGGQGMLDERKQKILPAVIQNYISSAEPVNEIQACKLETEFPAELV